MKIDTFYTIPYKKAWIHCKSVNNKEQYTVQIYDNKFSYMNKDGAVYFTKEYKTLLGAKRFITNWNKLDK